MVTILVAASTSGVTFLATWWWARHGRTGMRAILEDTESGVSYAVLERELEDRDEGEIVVTDLEGNVIEDEELVEDILENYTTFAEEAADDGGAKA